MQTAEKQSTLPLILLIEDNPGDVLLTQEAFRSAGVAIQLVVASDGDMAIKMLEGKQEFINTPTPSLILLDLNLPKRNGRDILHTLKNTAYLKRIPIIVMTSSVAQLDVNDAYDSHANCYIPKPADLDEFESIARSINQFWLSTVALPSCASAK